MLLDEDAPVSLSECAALSERVLLLPQDQHVLRATYGNIPVRHVFRGRRSNLPRLVVGDDAVRHYRSQSSIFGEVFVYVHQGCALLESGRLRDAEALLRQAWHLARDTTGPNTETEAVAACMLAVALYEKGDVEESETLLTPALAAMEQGESWYELLSRSYDVAAAIARRRGGFNAALAVIRRVRATAATRDIDRLEEFADVLELQSGPLPAKSIRPSSFNWRPRRVLVWRSVSRLASDSDVSSPRASRAAARAGRSRRTRCSAR